MQLLVELVERYGLGLVFLTVLIEQIGLPIPSYPILVVTAALSTQGNYRVPQVIAWAVFACLLADFGWYRVGARFGRRVLALMCRISLSPDSCVRQTENIFGRYGAASLLISKFVPGFAHVAPPLAGAFGFGIGSFLVYNAIGAVLWAGAGLILGLVFYAEIDWLLVRFAAFGLHALMLVALLVAIYLAYRWIVRRRNGR